MAATSRPRGWGGGGWTYGTREKEEGKRGWAQKNPRKNQRNVVEPETCELVRHTSPYYCTILLLVLLHRTLCNKTKYQIRRLHIFCGAVVCGFRSRFGPAQPAHPTHRNMNIPVIHQSYVRTRYDTYQVYYKQDVRGPGCPQNRN